MDAIKALHEWKKGGRSETMISTFEYKSSDWCKENIEGFQGGEIEQAPQYWCGIKE